tara:strand:- start:547 stop:2673 length:2127 start_codon:yes stop_codon:yes gene_type:complete
MPSESSSKRKLAAILFADIVGYTALMQQGENKTMSILNRFQEVTTAKVKEHKGQIIKSYGDGSLILFESTVDAVNCAYQMQLAFGKGIAVPLRIGIHVGEVVHKDNDIFGNGVNIASRVESMGIAGAVLLSKTAMDRVKNQEAFDFKSLGPYEFKNVEEPLEVLALANKGLIVPKSIDIKGKGQRFEEKNRNWTLWKVMIVLILLAALSYSIFDIALTESPSDELKENVSKSQDDKNIAVLPFLNLNSKDENLEYFSDGVTNEIIDKLSQIRVLNLTAFTTTIRYKQTTKTNDQISKELNCRYLISGTSRIFSSGDSVRLSLELIDTKENNKRVWSSTFNEKMDDAPNIQITIAKQVAKSLNVELSNDEKSIINSVNTTSGEAYRLFLLARSEFYKLNKEGFRRSIEALEEVIKIDPNYAQAHTFLAWAYQLSTNPWFDGHINKPIKELNALVTPIIKKSLELDSSNSDIFLVRAHQKAFMDNSLRDAKKDVDLALEINSWPVVPTNYCMCVAVSTYIALDFIEPATDVIELARKLDPGNVFLEWDAANVLMKKGLYEEAQIYYSNAAKIAPISMFKTFLGWNYYHTNEYDLALDQLLNTYRESELPISLNVAYLSNTYYQKGDRLNSDKFLQELMDRDYKGEHHINLYIATVYVARGENKIALDYLEKAFKSNNWGMALMMNLDPIFQSLYDDRRFIEIRKRMQYYQ